MSRYDDFFYLEGALAMFDAVFPLIWMTDSGSVFLSAESYDHTKRVLETKDLFCALQVRIALVIPAMYTYKSVFSDKATGLKVQESWIRIGFDQ